MPNQNSHRPIVDQTSRFYNRVRTELTSHAFALLGDRLWYAMTTEDDGRIADAADAVGYYANGRGAQEMLPDGIPALADVLRVEYTTGVYRWFAYDHYTGEYLTDANGNRMPPAIDPDTGRTDFDNALEDYIPASRVVTYDGPIPARPTGPEHTTEGNGPPCAACQLAYDNATPQLRSAVEDRENGTGRVVFHSPREEDALLEDLFQLGRSSGPVSPSDALRQVLEDAGLPSDCHWQFARCMHLNTNNLPVTAHRRVVRGQLDTVERLQNERDAMAGCDQDPWRCTRCDMWSAGPVNDYTDRGRSRTACQHCTDEMTYCENCEVPYSGDYCTSCPDDDNYDHYHDDYHDGRSIHDYSYKPSAELHGDGPLYFGIELETSVTNGEVDRCATALAALSNGEDDYYLKYDGSVYSGFEIVTHPFDLDSWHDYLPRLTEVLGAASRLSARSWNQSSCGLHIHASRNGLRSDSAIAREAHLYRIVKFVEDNAAPMCKFAGRLSDQWATYDKDRRGISKLDAVKDHNRNAYGQNRYQAVNLLPRHTIEFRLFRPSLRPETVLAAVELTHGIISHTSHLSANACISGALRFDALVAFMSARPDTYPNALAKVASRVVPPTPTETDGDRD